MVLRKITKSQSQNVVLKIFVKLLKSQLLLMIFYVLKKFYVDACMNIKYYFDKYFEIRFLPFFFYQWIILYLNSKQSQSSTIIFCDSYFSEKKIIKTENIMIKVGMFASDHIKSWTYTALSSWRFLWLWVF